MPYIGQDQRDRVAAALAELVTALGEARESSGDDENIGGILNYAVTILMKDSAVPKRYKDYERLVGMLECCKLELYRRIIAPYEDEKISSNGDVYQ